MCLDALVCLYATGGGGGSFCEENGEVDLLSGRPVRMDRVA